MQLPPHSMVLAATVVSLLPIISGASQQHGVHEVIPEYELKPVYNIAHMVNSIEKFDNVIKLGANGIQVDVEFDAESGNATDAHFGSGCNCLPEECERRVPISNLFDHIRTATNKGGIHSHPLAIIVLHLKTDVLRRDQKLHAGADLAHRLIRDLWYGVPAPNILNVLVSVKNHLDILVILGTNKTVLQYMPDVITRLGFDVRDDLDLEGLRNMYNGMGRNGRYWLGDGVSTCKMETRDDERLQTILDQRDTEDRLRYIQKVYHRTVDLPEQMERSLRRGVDAIITNRPGRLNHLIKYKYHPMMRLATLDDDPFVRFGGWTPSLRLPRNEPVNMGDEFLEVVPGVDD
uniref:GP-PDE domain-containing protein n=1 Tax=Amblyomma maculatum TaxID=34609 RepID=G3MT02_AMBMU